MESQSSINAIGDFLSNLPMWLFLPVLIAIIFFYALMVGGSCFFETRNRAYLGENDNDGKRK